VYLTFIDFSNHTVRVMHTEKKKLQKLNQHGMSKLDWFW